MYGQVTDFQDNRLYKFDLGNTLFQWLKTKIQLNYIIISTYNFYL